MGSGTGFFDGHKSKSEDSPTFHVKDCLKKQGAFCRGG